MPTRIKMRLTVDSIANAIAELEKYENSLDRKSEMLCEKLAELGGIRAEEVYNSAQYDGENDVHVDINATENGGRVLEASGEHVMFIEFGSGVTHSDTVHPLASQFGYGPGTWPDKHYRKYMGRLYANWENPKGWYLPKEKGGKHTYGNPPAMAMYLASTEMRQRLYQTAREVFG